MALKHQLRRLGFASYSDYLLSDWWTDFRRRYKGSESPQKCAVCESPDYQLHHRTYERLGAEELSDVVPLCQKHHDALHQWLRAREAPLDWTDRAIEALRAKLDTGVIWFKGMRPKRKHPKTRAVEERRLRFEAYVGALDEESQVQVIMAHIMAHRPSHYWRHRAERTAYWQDAWNLWWIMEQVKYEDVRPVW